MRATLALVFVGALTIVLLQPILDTSNEQSPSNEPPRTPAASPAPKPAPSPTSTEEETETAAPDRLLSKIPRECLRPVERPSGVGLLAAYRGGAVRIASPTGGVTATIEAKPPIAWSPSGSLLLTHRGHLFTAEGLPAGPTVIRGKTRAFPEPVTFWTWSTVADCAVGVSREGTLLIAPLDAPIRRPHRDLLRGMEIRDISFSPDGRTLALVVRTDNEPPVVNSIWFADLRTGRITRTRAGAVAVPLLGWNGRRVLFGRATGASIMADGIRLEGLSPGGEVVGYRAGLLPSDDFLLTCGNRLLAVVGGARDATTNKRLAFIEPGEPPELLTSKAFVYSTPACSPNGDFVVAPRAEENSSPSSGQRVDDRRLVLLRGDGSFVRNLTLDSGFADEYPLWGPRGTGVVFVRRPIGGGGRPQAWFIPEGGRAQRTELTFAIPPHYYGDFAWERVLAWSAAPG